MKKIWLVLLVVLIGLLGASCGNKEQEKNSGLTVTFSESENQGVSKELLETDINNIDIYAQEGMNLLSYEIIKQQTNIESKEDIIWIKTNGENDKFSIVRNFKLTYILYNDGCWKQ